MANERSRLMPTRGDGVDARRDASRGERRPGARFFGPFRAGDAVGRGPGREGEGTGARGRGGRGRWASACACAAPLAAAAVLVGARAHASATSSDGGGLRALVMARHRGTRGGWNATTTEGGDGRERERASERDANAATRGEGEGEATGRASIAATLAGETASSMTSSYSAWEGEETKTHPSSTFDAGRSTGVALHGWLHLEEWFFAQGASHDVSADRRDENGVCFPPMFPDAASLGFTWSSEGDLVNKLVKHFGAKSAVTSFSAHRAQYVTDEDLLEIASQGIEMVRLPLSWSIFARDPATVPRGGERILVDPVYPDRLFVNMAGADLDAVIERIRNAGLKVLIDLHNMPGGAAAGTYNGVFPHPPMMFARDDLSRTGLLIVRNMLNWFKSLPEDSRLAVHGITLLNEPGHNLPAQRSKVLRWLAKAVQTYKDEIVNDGVPDGERVPYLYVNLIETLDLNVADMAAWMRSQFTVKELESWAVLDVHHYFAWSYTGCMGGTNAGCAFSCDDKPSVVAQKVGERAGEWAGTFRAAAQTYGVQNLAVSEWSLATFSDSSRSCSNREVLDIMFEHQEQAYRGAGIQSFFWGWKMPHGGSHIKAWSLSDYLAGRSASERKQHALVPHGYSIEDTLELPQGASKEDAARLIRAYSQFPDKPAEDKDSPDTMKIQTKEMLKLLSAVAGQSTAAVGESDHARHRRSRGGPSAADATENYLRASSKLKSIIDTDAYDDDDNDDDKEIIVVRHSHASDVEKTPVGDPIRLDLPSPPPSPNVTAPADVALAAAQPSPSPEPVDDGSIDSLLDPAKDVPPPPPAPPPMPPPPPPMPPPKSVLRAQQRAAETLSDLSLTSGEGFSIPDDGFDESSSVGASTIDGF